MKYDVGIVFRGRSGLGEVMDARTAVLARARDAISRSQLYSKDLKLKNRQINLQRLCMKQN